MAAIHVRATLKKDVDNVSEWPAWKRKWHTTQRKLEINVLGKEFSFFLAEGVWSAEGQLPLDSEQGQMLLKEGSGKPVSVRYSNDKTLSAGYEGQSQDVVGVRWCFYQPFQETFPLRRSGPHLHGDKMRIHIEVMVTSPQLLMDIAAHRTFHLKPESLHAAFHLMGLPVDEGKERGACKHVCKTKTKLHTILSHVERVADQDMCHALIDGLEDMGPSYFEMYADTPCGVDTRRDEWVVPDAEHWSRLMNQAAQRLDQRLAVAAWRVVMRSSARMARLPPNIVDEVMSSDVAAKTLVRAVSVDSELSAWLHSHEELLGHSTMAAFLKDADGMQQQVDAFGKGDVSTSKQQTLGADLKQSSTALLGCCRQTSWDVVGDVKPLPAWGIEGAALGVHTLEAYFD